MSLIACLIYVTAKSLQQAVLAAKRTVFLHLLSPPRWVSWTSNKPRSAGTLIDI